MAALIRLGRELRVHPMARTGTSGAARLVTALLRLLYDFPGEAPPHFLPGSIDSDMTPGVSFGIFRTSGDA
ncbi:MAG TPA: hypothetical protein VG777_09585 [Thermoanaerobaculia bacterium]|nr:hypothetical protein [Thermoanaerobaculia bacterium]